MECLTSQVIANEIVACAMIYFISSIHVTIIKCIVSIHSLAWIMNIQEVHNLEIILVM